MRMMAWVLLLFVFVFSFGIYSTANLDRDWASSKRVEGKVIGYQKSKQSTLVQYSYIHPDTQKEEQIKYSTLGSVQKNKVRYPLGSLNSVWINEKGQVRVSKNRPDSKHLMEIILITCVLALICGCLFWFSRTKP